MMSSIPGVVKYLVQQTQLARREVEFFLLAFPVVTVGDWILRLFQSPSPRSDSWCLRRQGGST